MDPMDLSPVVAIFWLVLDILELLVRINSWKMVLNGWRLGMAKKKKDKDTHLHEDQVVAMFFV
jgi:hypothetical protein